MVDIYDELGHIKNILANGLDGVKWQRDAKLLARFYASEGKKKSEVKKILREKCEKYALYYNHVVYFKVLNKIIDTAYKENKQGKPIRHITKIEIPKEAVDWFLNLEKNFTIDDEKKKNISKNRKRNITNHPINLNRTKMLFTFYIWTLVQKDYVRVPNVHYIKKYMKRFKEDANLPKSFSVNVEKNILSDLGLLYINGEQGIDPVFMVNYPEFFNVEITEKNRVILSGDDMYNCGLWLEKQKFGSFVCQNCGREFPFKGKGKGEKTRKYCEECSKLLYGKMEVKEKICVDCGKNFTTPAHDTRSIRCYECQREHKKQLQKKRLEKNG